jgi:Arc/MetJ-type ribon-helix-helix transcriptional regulator
MENQMPNVLSFRPADTEKVTVNLGVVDLGRIDLLVVEGFYSNRTDFIRTAVRNQITSHGDVVSKSIERQMMELGLRDLGVAELQAAKKAGERLDIRVVGLLRIAPDVTVDLALDTIAGLTVLGAIQASPELKAALKDRIT